jgi:hypothetical protein
VSEPQREAVAKSIEVPLEPLCMKGLSAVQQQEVWRELQREAQRWYPHAEGPVLGAQKLQEQAPHTRPGVSSRLGRRHRGPEVAPRDFRRELPRFLEKTPGRAVSPNI